MATSLLVHPLGFQDTPLYRCPSCLSNFLLNPFFFLLSPHLACWSFSELCSRQSLDNHTHSHILNPCLYTSACICISFLDPYNILQSPLIQIPTRQLQWRPLRRYKINVLNTALIHLGAPSSTPYYSKGATKHPAAQGGKKQNRQSSLFFFSLHPSPT